MHAPIQGYLTHKKQRPPKTLLWEYAEGPMVVLGRGAVSYERGSPVPGYWWAGVQRELEMKELRDLNDLKIHDVKPISDE